MAGREIDDAQASHPEADARLDVDPLVVRPAMANHVAHAMYECELRVVTGRGPRHRPVIVCESGNSTHVLVRSRDERYEASPGSA
jgi:hypothetical protein